MLYHISEQSGLKILKPHTSTHKKPYVYAIENMVTGLLFGVKNDDFDFIISTDENGRPIIYECYPDAFKEKYHGRGCSVYEVSGEGFKRGITSWEPELVNDSEVRVINEIVVDDLYDKLLEEEKKGNLIVYRYQFCDEYRKKIAAHIVDRIIRFDIDMDNILNIDRRFSTHYSGIVRSLREAMDGHLLE